MVARPSPGVRARNPNKESAGDDCLPTWHKFGNLSKPKWLTLVLGRQKEGWFLETRSRCCCRCFWKPRSGHGSQIFPPSTRLNMTTVNPLQGKAKVGIVTLLILDRCYLGKLYYSENWKWFLFNRQGHICVHFNCLKVKVI